MNYTDSDFEVIWRKGDGEMPEHVKHVVEAARKEKQKRALAAEMKDFEVASVSSTSFWDNTDDEVWDEVAD